MSLQTMLVIALLWALPSQSARRDWNSGRYFKSALVHYEDLNYEKAIEQLKKSQLKSTNAQEACSAALLEGIILADWGKPGLAEAAFAKGFGIAVEAQLPVATSPRIIALSEKARVEARQKFFGTQTWQSPSTCVEVEQSLDALWSEQSRARLLLKFKNSKQPEISAVAQALIHRMDAWTDVWADQQLALCVRRDVQRSISDQEATARATCLSRSGDAFTVLIETIDASAELEASATQLVGQLPDPADCVQSPLESPAQIAASAAVRTPLLRAKALIDVGQFESAQKHFEAAQKASTGLKAPLLMAELNACLGQLENAKGNTKAAITAYQQAVTAAIEAGAPRQAVASLLLLIDLEGKVQRNFKTAQTYFDWAMRLIRRAKDADYATAKVLLAWSRVLIEAQKNEQALALLSRALHLLDRLDANDFTARTKARIFASLDRAHTNLARNFFDDRSRLHYLKAADYSEAAVQLLLDTMGPESSDLAPAWNNLGAVHLEVTGNLEQAERALNASMELARKYRWKDNTYNTNFGFLYYLTNRLELAQQALQLDLDWTEKKFGPQHPEMISSLFMMGHVQRAMGQPARAAEYHLRALEIVKVLMLEDKTAFQGDYEETFLHLGIDYALLENWSEVAKSVRSCKQATRAKLFKKSDVLYCQVLTYQWEWATGAHQKAVTSMTALLDTPREKFGADAHYADNARALAKSWLQDKLRPTPGQ